MFRNKKILFLLFCSILFSCKKQNENKTTGGNWQINWITTDHAEFKDESGRILQLRGINARVDGLFDVSFNDGRASNEIVPAFTKEDVDSIAKLGFNFIRLPINWSGYEPEPGVYNPDYIPHIREVVNWCHDAGIYVQIDWHADAYSKEIGEDGAPYWALKSLPSPRWSGPLNFFSLALRRANSQAFKNYAFLIHNGNGIRDHFMTNWTNIIDIFKDDPTIIGYEPLNEPTAYFGGIKEDEFLGFYKECSQRMRAIDTKHLLWLEPDASRIVFDQGPLLQEPFPDDKVVYCPHYYPNLLQGANYSTVEQWTRNTNKSFNRIVEEGESWGAPTVINEWGINPSTTSGKSLIIAYRQQMEERHLQGAFWLWKEPEPGTSGADNTWGFFDDLGNGMQWKLREDAVMNFVVPYMMALPGTYSSHHFNPDTKILSCTFIYNNSGSNPIAYIPFHIYPNGFEIYVNGKKASYQSDAYHRYSIQWVPTNGSSTIEICPK